MPNVNRLLTALLEATAEQTAAKARIDKLRDAMADEARRRYIADGMAPSWKSRELGTVRMDPPGDPRPTVRDDDAFGSWLAQRHPDYCRAVIEVDPTTLDDALGALDLAGVERIAPPRVAYTKTALDDALAGLNVEPSGDNRDADLVIDHETGEVLDLSATGLTVTRTDARLVVTLDPAAKRDAIADAELRARDEIIDATIDDEPEAAADQATDLLEPLMADTTALDEAALGVGGGLPTGKVRK